jgi:arabinofuranosyltransferase
VLAARSFAAILGSETKDFIRRLEKPGSRAKLLLVLIVLYAIAINAWVSEDAFITFRSIDQLNAGNGPRWNPHERVQAFTHPLWFWLLGALSQLVPNLFFASLVLGLLCTLGALAILWKLLRRVRGTPTAVLGILAFISSKAVIDYSTSGLENSLSHLLLLALLLASYLWFQAARPRHLTIALGIAFLLVVTRHDSVVLTLPIVVLLLASGRERLGWPRTLGLLAIASTPLLLWESFSLIYYGFLFPNSAYAKLFYGQTPLLALPRGLWYLTFSAVLDPLLLAVPIACMIGLRSSDRSVRALALGIALHAGYVVWIGGDYMAGRFLTTSFIASLFVILSSIKEQHLARVAIGLALWLIWPLHPLNPLADRYSGITSGGVADERAYSSAATPEACALSLAIGGLCPEHPWIRQGKDFADSDRLVVFRTGVGTFGYAAGTEKIIVDEFAIADALLARLPTTKVIDRAGHLSRDIPAGYLEGLESGINQIEDAHLREYYDKLRVLTQAPIFSRHRLNTIVRFNLGRYDHLLDKYLEAQEKAL